jgi:hypothetical protein
MRGACIHAQAPRGSDGDGTRRDTAEGRGICAPITYAMQVGPELPPPNRLGSMPAK